MNLGEIVVVDKLGNLGVLTPLYYREKQQRTVTHAVDSAGYSFNPSDQAQCLHIARSHIKQWMFCRDTAREALALWEDGNE